MSYLTEVIADSPIHYWRMADPGGYRLGDIGSAQHASMTPNQGPSLSTIVPYTGPNANGGSAASGIRLFTFCPIVGGTTFSIELLFWGIVKGSAYSKVVEVETAAGQYASLSVNPGAFAAWSVGSGPSVTTGSHTVTPESWHHCVLTNDGTTVRAYLDALTDGTASPPTMTLFPIEVDISGDHTNANEKSGFWISELAIYSTVLSPTRINAHFLALDNNSPPIWRGTSASDTSSLLSQLADIRDAVIRTPLVPGQV